MEHMLPHKYVLMDNLVCLSQANSTIAAMVANDYSTTNPSVTKFLNPLLSFYGTVGRCSPRFTVG